MHTFSLVTSEVREGEFRTMPGGGIMGSSGIDSGMWFFVMLLWGVIVAGLALLVRLWWDAGRPAGRQGQRPPILLRFEVHERRHEPGKDHEAAGVTTVGELLR